MKIFTLIFLILIFPITLFAQTNAATVVIKPIKANLRGTPSASGKIVIEVVQGQVFDVLIENGEWYLVQTPMFVGWLHQSVVAPASLYAKEIKVEKKPLLSEPLSVRDIPIPPTINEPKYLSDSEDNGYDVALVRSQTATLFDAQGISLLTMRSNDELAIIKRPSSNDYVRVIHIESGKNGYVLKKDISLYYTRKPKTSESPFSEQRTASYKNPEITVSNTTDRVLRLTVGSNELELAPSESRTIVIEEGSYDFFASAANVRPLIGNKYFSKGVIYSWTFYIKRS